MNHYSNNPGKVRVDFFKSSGKWYATEVMRWLFWHKDTLIHDAFALSLRQQFKGHYQGMTAVCLEPYHEHAHPVMLHNWEAYFSKAVPSLTDTI